VFWANDDHTMSNDTGTKASFGPKRARFKHAAIVRRGPIAVACCLSHYSTNPAVAFATLHTIRVKMKSLLSQAHQPVVYKSFKSMCGALQRNDPKVHCVRTKNESCTGSSRSAPCCYGQRLGDALQYNTVVTEIELDVSDMLSKRDKRMGTIDSTARLLQWMTQSPSLQSVTLCGDGGFAYGKRRYVIVERLLLQGLLAALAQNSNIRAVELNISHLPLSLFAEYIATVTTLNGPRLSTLKIHVKSWSAALFRDHADSSSLIENVALAMAGLSNLQVLQLHVGAAIEPVLQKMSTWLSRALSSLRELSLNLYSNESVTGLCSLLPHMPKLQLLGLASCTVIEWWSMVALALQSSPSVQSLTLHKCIFSQGEAPRVLRDLLCSERHRIVNLRLDSCIFLYQENRPDFAVEMAVMISCCTKLESLAIRNCTMKYFNSAGFFSILASTTNKDSNRLCSLHIDGMQHPDALVHVSPYVTSTGQLRHLTLGVKMDPVRHCKRQGPQLQVPAPFLAALRCNSSLYSVKMHCDGNNSLDLLHGNKAARLIEATTLRNRLLPGLLQASLDGEADGNTSLSTSSASPTLCLVVQQAHQTAPRALLKGFLATVDTFGLAPSSDSSRG
jgi:hypothetical protein